MIKSAAISYCFFFKAVYKRVSSFHISSELTEAKQADKLGVEPFELLKFREEKSEGNNKN